MPATLTAPTTAPVGDQQIQLDRIPWDLYLTISNASFERRSPKMIYVDGRLTLLSPSRRHDWFADCLGHLVVALANGFEIPCEPSGTATYRQEEKGGVEGDKAYYFGAHAELMKGPVNIDLTTQPPPDLAIEVEVTHAADDAVKVWGRIGVPEVWRLDADRGTLTFGLRRDDGTYAPSPHSAAFPVLEPADVLGQLRRAEGVGFSSWHAQLDTWVRDVLVPRRVP